MKNLNLLINRTEGSVREAQSFVQVNLREGSTRPRQDLEKTSLKGRALSRMSSFMSRPWKVVASIMLLLTLGVGQMWAGNAGYVGNGESYFKNYLEYNKNGGSATQFQVAGSGQSDLALGTVTSLSLTQYGVGMYQDEDNLNGKTSDKFCYWIHEASSSSESWTEVTGNWEDWNTHDWSSGWRHPGFGNNNLGIDVLDGLDPGDYKLTFYFKHQGNNNWGNAWLYLSNGGDNYNITFTVPGFTTTSTSQTFDNTTVSSNSSKTISFTQHYGTALTTSDCELSGTNNSEFEVTAISETGVTVKFKPSTAGSKSATLTITDAHSETCTITLSGKTQYTVSYNKGSNGTGSNTTANKVYGTNLTLLGATFTRTGYTQTAWNTNSAGTGGTSYSLSGTYSTEAAVTLYPTWTANTYSITLDDDGDYGGNGSATATYNGTALSVSSHASRDGWNLVGYFAAGTGDQVTDASGNLLPSKSFSDGSNHAITNSSSQWIYDGDLTLYAHWSKEYSVTYNANGGSGTMTDASSPYEAGSNVTVLTNTFTRSGYTFTGWNTDSGGEGSSYANGATISSIAANVTLYAQWSENDYTVAVTAGSNGSVASSSVTGHKDTKVTLPAATANTGYHFSTWTTTSGSVTYTNQTNATTAQVNGLTAAAAVRADFAANTYSVVFNANGGTGTMSNEAFTYDASAKALTSNSFTRSGYTFVGWATTADRANAMNIDYTNGQSVRNLTSTNGGTFNLYAVWAKKYYIGGRFQHDWEDGTSTTNEMTYDTSTGKYKFTTSKTVSELSAQWHNVSGNYDADQVFFIHTGTGKVGSSSNPFYTTPNEDGAGLNFETCNSYSNALVLVNQETEWGEIVTNRLLQFSNIDNLSSSVIIWWDPANKKVWYAATESLNTNYYLLGFGEGSWSEVDGRRFKVASVNATTATVSVSLTAKTYTGTNDGFKVKNHDGTWYGNTGTMTRANCTGWTFSSNVDNNCGITADMAGSYTFTLNLSTMAVSVDYPAETMHTVSVVADGSGGTVSTASVSAGITTPSTTITATPTNKAWRFHYWTIPDGVTIVGGDNTAASITINATADSKTITAHYQPRFALVGSLNEDGNPAGGMPCDPSTGATWGYGYAADFTVESYTTPGGGDETITVDLECERTLLANRDYKFQVYDRSTGFRGLTSAAVLEANTTAKLTGSADVYLNTVGAGTYTFKISKLTNDENVYPTIEVIRQSSYSVTFGEGTGNGTAVTATGSTSGSITSGQYVAAGENVTFTQTPASGYTFAGWYTASSGGSAVSGMSTSDNVLDAIAANANVYAQYTENMCTVTLNHTGNGHIEIGGATVTETTAGVATTPTIVAVPDAGWYFAGWTVSDGADCSVASTAGRNDNESSSTTLRGLGAGTTGTVTARFVEGEKIYFRDVFDDGETISHWGDVYVNFGITWNGYNQAVTNASNASWRVHMSKITGTNVWWAYVPRSFTVSENKNVGFTKTNQDGNGYTFYNTKAATRGDYNKLLNMFVPFHTAKSTGNNEVDYFDNGYWMNYDTKASQGAGYYLKQYNSRNNYTQKGEFVANTDSATIIQFKLRIDAASSTLNYMITSAGALNYVAASTITAANCSDIELNENTETLSDHDVKFSLTTTSEGYYTFIIDQSGDKMTLTVEYPVSPGDYILENVYDDGSSKTTHSNVIKAADAATKTRYSMFLSNQGSGTLKLRKCTSISAGEPVWSEGDATSVAAIMTAVGSTPGVYQFDIAINTSTHEVSEVDSVRLYTGNYYIKTDAATGGWVEYQKNVMDKNTVNFDRTSATFDNYWCHYFSSQDANIKCVIANDYCNQLSDTIKSDGIARMVGTEPYVPVAGTSIRFSYNSATNTIGRAYLGASENDNYLDITPYEAGKIYNTSVEDLHDKGANKRRFEDMGNWVYEKDLKVVPGGKAGVQATYTDASSVDHVQNFLPTTNIVLGGSGEEKYTIRIVYDFKTNYMMSTWVPEGEITEALENVDLLWVRKGQEPATQITIGDGGSLSSVHAVGAIQFEYNKLNRSAAGHIDLTEWNSTSRPYLKYFISFPFDVPVNSIFGLNQAVYGREYIIQKYNGAQRAAKGLFYGDDGTFWENLTTDSVMHANEGYCVMLDNDYLSGLYGNIWDNKSEGSSIYLYFPAKSTISTLTNASTNVTIAAHTCTKDREFTQGGKKYNHKNTDSHWNLIGSPLFHDSYIYSSAHNGDSIVGSYYAWNSSDNKWYAQALSAKPKFNAMSCVMVQWHGTIKWSIEAPAEYPGSMSAPKRGASELENRLIKLELVNNDEAADWTFVEMREGADADFVLCEDMFKIENSGKPNIYVFAGDYDVAYSQVPVETQTVPVGVIIRKKDYYTFSMPTDFSGTVTLVDTYEQTRTNLNLSEYEVYLEPGTLDDRFYLEINIKNVATSLENADGNNVLNDGGYHKFVRDDKLFILKNGVVYDAQGRKVE